MEYPFIINSKDLSMSDSVNFYLYLQRNKDNILSQLYKFGAILFRGFNLLSAQNFEEAVKIFNPNLSSYIGGDSPRSKVSGNVYTSTTYPPEETISMHQEKSFSNNYPALIFFFCEIAPYKAGETPIVDARKIYNLLDKEIINKFKEKKLKYVMNLHSGYGFGRSWQESFEVETKDELIKIIKNLNISYKWKNDELLEISEIVLPIIKHPIINEYIFFSQADQWHYSGLKPDVLKAISDIVPKDDFYHNCYYGDGSEIEIEYLDEIRKTVNEQRVLFPWQKGDLLMLDNMISMHGRMPFNGQRKILTAMVS